MLEVKGKKYSRERFDDYKYRARVTMEVVEVKDHKVMTRKVDMDVYTTEHNQQYVENVLFEHSSENVTQLNISWWATRAQDDAAAEFIEEFLK